MLGDNPHKPFRAKFRIKQELWKEGIFLASHGISFDSLGDIIVMDWNSSGCLTYLEKLDDKKGQ